MQSFNAHYPTDERISDIMKARKRSGVFIIDDHVVFREGLSLLIEQTNDLEVCGEAGDAGDAIKSIKGIGPDIILLDISLKESSGIELLKDLKKSRIKTPVLVLSMHDETYYAERALRAGARGYIMKQEPSQKLLEAIRRILGGKIYLSEKMTDHVLDTRFDKKKSSDVSPAEFLSDRELEVLELIGRGLSTHQIAHKVNLNVKTVGTYRQKIKEKLKLKSAAELVKYAIHWVEHE